MGEGIQNAQYSYKAKTPFNFLNSLLIERNINKLEGVDKTQYPHEDFQMKRDGEFGDP